MDAYIRHRRVNCGVPCSARQARFADERASTQLRTIHHVVRVLRAVGISAWLFGGWGLDARIGRITRDHNDIEFWADRTGSDRSKAILIEAGATARATQPSDEACEFTWDGVDFSTAYFDREPDGTFTVKGRWSDWVFPAGSFSHEPGVLDGIEVPAMSVAGMLAMKEQFPSLPTAGPGEQKTEPTLRSSEASSE